MAKAVHSPSHASDTSTCLSGTPTDSDSGLGHLSVGYSGGLDGATCIVGSMMSFAAILCTLGFAFADTQQDLVVAADDTLSEEIRMDAFFRLVSDGSSDMNPMP